MDELATNRAFVQVVESGSFSAAARRLNTSVSSIARQVNALETMLGVRLLNRTTRQQSLTEAGQLYYENVRHILREIDTVKREVSSYQDAVKGLLRAHLRTSAGNQVVVPALPRFLERYPGVTLDITLTDERVDLVAKGLDVAVWLGNLEDSSMIARRLSRSRRVLCGAAGYLRRMGVPETPADLTAHNCLVYTASHYGNIWRFSRDGDTTEVTVSGNLQTISSSVLMSSALNGLGLIVVQEWMVREALRSGDLVRVLADYDVSPTEFDTALYAVYPHSRRLSPKTRAFIDFLVDLFNECHCGEA